MKHPGIRQQGFACAFLLGAGGFHVAAAADQAVNFRYAPAQWQTAICLPDDPQKSLVDDHGALLYHYGRGGHEFASRLTVAAAPDAVRQQQELVSPRIPIVRTTQAAPGLRITQEAFADTDPPTDGGPRNDWILIRLSNTGAEQRTVTPQLIVDTRMDFQRDGQHARVNGCETIHASLGMTAVTLTGKSRHAIQLDALVIAPGKSAEFAVLYCAGAALPPAPPTVGQALAARDRAAAWWDKAPLPYNRIQVPDAGIQALVDSSIRNIWQAREIKNGLPAFQVGPTCYRGLWIADGAFLLEAATLLGAGDQARNGVAYELTHQQADGRIQVMEDFSKENGIVLWTCVRHARLTQDKAWLESVWPQLRRIAGYIKTLRRQTLTNDTPLDDGLVPPGMPDGGISGVLPEYTNPFWNMAGLRAYIEAARWLGKTDEAAAWQREYEDFTAAFRKAAARDLRQEARGMSYLPTLMGEAGAKELPQRGQWGFCHAVYPGQLFGRTDPVACGTMAMLEATLREGMVYGTGWNATGIWTYFASFYGHAWLWLGAGDKAAAALYAFANHAAPILAWREEQSLAGETYRQVGDMPHNWASAEFIRLTSHLLELDRGTELHLLEGLPEAWTQPGMRTQLDRIATPFGPLTMVLDISPDGKSASLSIDPLPDPSCGKIVVHPIGLSNKQIELDPKRRNTITLPGLR